MYYIIPIVLQITDSNMTGHADHLAMPAWFDRARTYLYREMDPTLAFKPHGLVVVHTELRYLKEVDFQQDGEVRTWTSRIGYKSYELTQEFWAKDERRAIGKVIMCGFDINERKSEPLIDQYRATLKKYYWDAPKE